MMNQDIQGLLASFNYQNERRSILSFKDGRLTKNDEFIGTYLVQREGDEDLLLITSEDLGTVTFYVMAETGDGKRTRIRLCRNKGDEACILLTEVGGASPL